MNFKVFVFVIFLFLKQTLLCQIEMPGYPASKKSSDERIQPLSVTREMPVNREIEDLIYTTAIEEIDRLVSLLTIEHGESQIRNWVIGEAVYRGATKCKVLWTKKIHEKDSCIVVITTSFIQGKEFVKIAKIDRLFTGEIRNLSLDKVFKNFQYCDLINGTLLLQNEFGIKCIDLSDFSEYDISVDNKLNKFNTAGLSNFYGEVYFEIEGNAESAIYEKLDNLSKVNSLQLVQVNPYKNVDNEFRYHEHNWSVHISDINNPFSVKKKIGLTDTMKNTQLNFEEVNSEWFVFLEVANNETNYDGVDLKFKFRNNGVWRDLGVASATKYSQNPSRTVYRLSLLGSRPITFLKSAGYSEDLAIADASNTVIFNTKSITCLTPLFYGAHVLRDLSGSCHYVNCIVPNEDQNGTGSLGSASGFANNIQGSVYAEGSAKIQGSGVGGGSYQLGSRSALERPKPRFDCDGEGIVVVKIYVDRNGAVKRADGQGMKGSTTNNECLIRRAEEAALKTRWQADPQALELQIGTIRYNFQRQ
jgi:hypothetical protein